MNGCVLASSQERIAEVCHSWHRFRYDLTREPLQPVVGDVAHLVERVEQVRAEHLFAVGPVESLDIRVLIGLAGQK